MARRILLLITDLKIGGTPTVVRELAVRLGQGGADHVEVACLDHWGPVADQLRDRGVGVTALDASGSWDLRIVPRLWHLIRRRRIDTVLSFLLHANAAAAAVAPMLPGVRFFQSIQTTQAYPRWHWRVQRVIHRLARRVVVPSPSVADTAQQRAGVPRGKLVIIPNALDANAFPPSRVPRDQPAPYPIGFVGRLDPVKRLPDLIEVAARLRGRVQVHIYGEGPQRPILENMIDQLALGDCVTLHGQIPRPQEALATLGLFVLPSINEGMPLVLLEAMAAGVPIVARDVPGVRDVVRDGHTGLLVRGSAVIDLVSAVQTVIEDPLLRRRLIEQAAAEVRSHFTWPVVLEQYRHLLA